MALAVTQVNVYAMSKGNARKW